MTSLLGSSALAGARVPAGRAHAPPPPARGAPLAVRAASRPLWAPGPTPRPSILTPCLPLPSQRSCRPPQLEAVEPRTRADAHPSLFGTFL